MPGATLRVIDVPVVAALSTVGKDTPAFVLCSNR